MEISNSNKSWFALYTKPRCEYKAAGKLLGLGIEFYLPSVTKLKQWSDRKKKVTEPLLRGYIFIFADEKERMISLENEYIVRCIFDHGRPAKIPDWQINNLKLFLTSNSDVEVNEGILTGKKIIIRDGPFEGVIGTIIDVKNEKSFAVSIDLLNRTVVALLPKESSFDLLKTE